MLLAIFMSGDSKCLNIEDAQSEIIKFTTHSSLFNFSTFLMPVILVESYNVYLILRPPSLSS